MKAGFEQAKEKISDRIRSEVRRDIGGDDQRINSVSTSYSRVTFKHILLPIWISSYQFKGRPYSVIVHGRTGEVGGDRPLSPTKISSVVLGTITAIAGSFGGKAYLDNQAEPALVFPGASAGIVVEYPTSPVSSEDTFSQALTIAQAAVSQGQKAKTAQDWKLITGQWEKAVILMGEVPSSSPNHVTALKKVTEYQRYFSYAREKAAKATP